MSTATHRSEQRQRREQVRAQIIAAADEALRERPYRELSVEELMAAAGLPRTIFYRHFDDLADLVVRLLEEAATELYQHEQRLAAVGDDQPEGIRRALEAPVHSFSVHGPLLRAVAEAASHDERIDAGYQALVQRFEQLIEAYLRALAGRGHTQLADPAQTARALNLMNLAYLLDVFGTIEQKVSPAVALQTLTEIWVGALLARPSP
jgi:TetR/AcrR family transcriptional regulator, ethionamide resistance regulator